MRQASVWYEQPAVEQQVDAPGRASRTWTVPSRPSQQARVVLRGRCRDAARARGSVARRRARLVDVGGLAEQEDDFRLLARLAARRPPAARAHGSSAGADAPGERLRGAGPPGAAGEPLRPRNSVRSPVQLRSRRRLHVGEGDRRAEVGVVGVAREQGAGSRRPVGDDVHLRLLARRAQHPLGVAGRPTAAAGATSVAQAQALHAHRSLTGVVAPGHEGQSAPARGRGCCARRRCSPGRGGRAYGVASPDRQRRRRPELAGRPRRGGRSPRPAGR